MARSAMNKSHAHLLRERIWSPTFLLLLPFFLITPVSGQDALKKIETVFEQLAAEESAAHDALGKKYQQALERLIEQGQLAGDLNRVLQAKEDLQLFKSNEWVSLADRKIHPQILKLRKSCLDGTRKIRLEFLQKKTSAARAAREFARKQIATLTASGQIDEAVALRDGIEKQIRQTLELGADSKPEAQKNLILNGGFSSGINGWTAGKGVTHMLQARLKSGDLKGFMRITANPAAETDLRPALQKKLPQRGEKLRLTLKLRKMSYVPEDTVPAASSMMILVMNLPGSSHFFRFNRSDHEEKEWFELTRELEWRGGDTVIFKVRPGKGVLDIGEIRLESID